MLAASALAFVLMDQFQDAIYQREKWLVAGLLLGAVWVSKPGREASRPRASTPASDAEALVLQGAGDAGGVLDTPNPHPPATPALTPHSGFMSRNVRPT